MKAIHKSLISFLSPAFGLVLLVFWAYTAKEPFDIAGYLIFALSSFLICIGIHYKVKNYKNQRLGLASDDELSKRIKEKATSRAFYISFYIWIFIILFVQGIEPKAKIIMGFGLLSMALVFFLNWLYYSKTGISDEDKN